MIATSSVSLVLWLGLVHSICSPPLSKNAPLVAIQKFACHPYTTSQIFPQRTELNDLFLPINCTVIFSLWNKFALKRLISM